MHAELRGFAASDQDPWRRTFVERSCCSYESASGAAPLGIARGVALAASTTCPPSATDVLSTECTYCRRTSGECGASTPKSCWLRPLHRHRRAGFRPPLRHSGGSARSRSRPRRPTRLLSSPPAAGVGSRRPSPSMIGPRTQSGCRWTSKSSAEKADGSEQRDNSEGSTDPSGQSPGGSFRRPPWTAQHSHQQAMASFLRLERRSCLGGGNRSSSLSRDAIGSNIEELLNKYKDLCIHYERSRPFAF